MSRRPTFTQAVVRRAVRAVEAAGKDVAAVEFSADGKFRIVGGKPGEQDSRQANALDAWIAKHAHAT